MATYSKRGYKPVKEKVEKEPVEAVEVAEDIAVLEKNSKTAEVFSTLDATASKTEAFVSKNQNLIFGVLGGIALITIGYIGYKKFIIEPKEETAADQMFVAQQNFQKAADGVAADSLYNLALNGAAGQSGFVKLADEYSGTASGNLANYYAGISYLNIKKYTEAISYLEKFKSEDMILNALAIGAIGDAYSEKNQPKEALEFYLKASAVNQNDYTTPRFLLKAGKTALALGNKEEALKHFTEIKEIYEATPEAASIDGLIGLAQ